MAESFEEFVARGAPDPLNAFRQPYEDLLIAINKATDGHGLRVNLDPRALIPFIPAAVAAMKNQTIKD